jgi:hypothetical protein
MARRDFLTVVFNVDSLDLLGSLDIGKRVPPHMVP